MRQNSLSITAMLLLIACHAVPSNSAADDNQPRARDLGIRFDGETGPLNAITDVPGVTVGHETIIRDLGDGRAARTGVTAIVPRGLHSLDTNVYAGWAVLNGNGEMTGTTWIEEGGFLEGPVMLTNTHSIGAVHEGTIKWRVARGGPDHSGYFWSAPLVAETWDGYLNDINGFHVRPRHAGNALDNASDGPVAEGSVGGGTGMICFEFKCGIGTASRVARVDNADFMVGVLVQANYGRRENLRISGVEVGRLLTDDRVWSSSSPEIAMLSSIIVVVATNAPLLPHQLERIARRAPLAIGRTGSIASNGSGDIMIAFSTANPEAARGESQAVIRSVPNDLMDPLFAGTVQATEEAIINALVAGTDMTGDDGHTVKGIDRQQLRQLMGADRVPD